MKNLVAGKLPLEDTWTFPERATDGNVTKYDGKNGFAYAYFPCTFTLDFLEVVKIKCVRIFLWDGAGIEKVGKSKRQYAFNLLYSLGQNKSYSIFESNGKHQGNGWFEFNFNEGIWLRYLTLECLDNTDNREFHIIQFEAWDSTPLPIKNTNKQVLSSINRNIDDEFLEYLVKKNIEDSQESLKGISGLAEFLRKKVSEVLTASEGVKIGQVGADFASLAEQNKSSYRRWGFFSALLFLCIFSFLVWSFMFDQRGKLILENKNSTGSIGSEYRFTLFIVYYIGKAVFLSILLFVATWLLKNYRSEKHNFIVNRHKAISLQLLVGLMTDQQYSFTNRDEIFREGMSLILRNENTGFTDKEEVGSNLINNFGSIKPNI